MVKYNSNILILIAVVGLTVIISGCVNSSEPPPTVNSPSQIQTPILTSNPVVNQRSSMSFYEFEEAMRSNDLTSLQKENLYANKIFTWNGQVTDVTQGQVQIKIEYCQTGGYINMATGNYVKIKIQQFCDPKDTGMKNFFYIYLQVDDDQKPKLNSLSEGQIITFEGAITDNPSFEMANMHGRIIG